MGLGRVGACFISTWACYFCRILRTRMRTSFFLGNPVVFQRFAATPTSSAASSAAILRLSLLLTLALLLTVHPLR